MMGQRESRPEAPKKQNGNGQERQRPQFSPFEQQYMFTEEVPSGERQPLLRTLTRLDDDSERRREGSRSIDSLKEPGRIGGTFFFSISFLHIHLSDFCFTYL